MGRGLLERFISQCAEGRVALDVGRLPSAGAARGNFLSKASDVRSSARFRYDVDVRYYANGFRVVRELQ